MITPNHNFPPLAMTPTSDRIRTTISVDPQVHAIFKQMAAASGMSVSRCMGEWLADTADGAQLIAQKMEEARRAPMAVMRELQSMVAGNSDMVETAIREMRENSLRSGRPAVRASGADGSAAANPPSSNTGVLVPPKSQSSRVKRA
jgi:hypothetical protein